jgi:hypothetical protein
MKYSSKMEELLEILQSNNTKFKEKTIESINWYRQKIRALYKDVYIDHKKILDKNLPNKNIPSVGSMITFQYYPKYSKDKKVLPYYDRYPLVLILSPIKNGCFSGLNFHYLHPIERANIMSELYKYESIDKETKESTINISLDSSVKLKKYKKLIKRYNVNYIKRSVYKLKSYEWNIMLFLPTEKFFGENKQKVWSDSRNIIYDKRK